MFFIFENNKIRPRIKIRNQLFQVTSRYIYLFLNLMSNVICFKILDDLFLTFLKKKLEQLEKKSI